MITVPPIILLMGDADSAKIFLAHQLSKFFLAGTHLGAPQFIGVMENELILVDLQPLAALAFALQNQGVVACLLQMIAEATAAIRGSQDPGLGRQGGDIEAAGAGSAGAGQGTGGDHDPVFFTENQAGTNPHERLTPVRSAEVIISHVTNGLALADKHHLPELIKDFIRTHHGLGKTKYFYITYKNEHPDEQVDESIFTYPGPNPSTKEQAILMMADAVEAASRSLKEYTEESISNLVDKIIDAQMAEGYFLSCDITFREIAVAKTVFKEKLKIIYHTRISYPEMK